MEVQACNTDLPKRLEKESEELCGPILTSGQFNFGTGDGCAPLFAPKAPVFVENSDGFHISSPQKKFNSVHVPTQLYIIMRAPKPPFCGPSQFYQETDIPGVAAWFDPIPLKKVQRYR